MGMQRRMKRVPHRRRTAGAFLLWQLLAMSLCPALVRAAPQERFPVHLRSRVAIPGLEDSCRVDYRQEFWAPDQTAMIVCDMWDQHWCQGATRRVAELGPVMNRVLTIARNRGVLIVHAPSGTLDHYQNHPARQALRAIPTSTQLPAGIGQWCHWLDETEKRAGYPIDHTDGGCDCTPRCQQGSPWSRQVESLTIAPGDFISDSGVEIWSLLEKHEILNVIVMGVHTNMCVLGRPFGLRNLKRHGKNVVLMRDLTDTMYNSRQAPRVNHFTGTDLIVEHTETYVCPTVTSTVFTGKAPFRFSNDRRPRVVFISAESEYGAAETLPGFARDLARHHGLSCEILQGSREKKGENRHELSGMELVQDADLVVVYARRRAFPADQMRYLRDYLKRGGALIGLRTASHAFDSRGSGPADHDEWPEFDAEVLGGNYHGHHGAGPNCTVSIAPGAEQHPLLAGMALPLDSPASLYEVRPLGPQTTPLLIGTIPGQEPEPVAWTHTYHEGRIFYTSLGHRDDFKNEAFKKLLVNAVFWTMDRPAR
jgi:type 1 glutamine amidotransferase/nicotinamidase-related amidase